MDVFASNPVIISSFMGAKWQVSIGKRKAGLQKKNTKTSVIPVAAFEGLWKEKCWKKEVTLKNLYP